METQMVRRCANVLRTGVGGTENTVRFQALLMAVMYLHPMNAKRLPSADAVPHIAIWKRREVTCDPP